ncbi:MAG: MBL fold metallo-hydrolase, partial [Ilumatobacter sp.]
VDPVETDHRITDEVCLVPTPGHTPGHVSVIIESAGQRALITGDAVHNPLQFAIPDLAATHFDHDSTQSSQTRRDLVDAHADQPTLVLGTHFAPPTAGHIRRDDQRVWFDS